MPSVNLWDVPLSSAMSLASELLSKLTRGVSETSTDVNRERELGLDRRETG